MENEHKFLHTMIVIRHSLAPRDTEMRAEFICDHRFLSGIKQTQHSASIISGRRQSYHGASRASLHVLHKGFTYACKLRLDDSQMVT